MYDCQQLAHHLLSFRCIEMNLTPHLEELRLSRLPLPLPKLGILNLLIAKKQISQIQVSEMQSCVMQILDTQIVKAQISAHFLQASLSINMD